MFEYYSCTVHGFVKLHYKHYANKVHDPVRNCNVTETITRILISMAIFLLQPKAQLKRLSLRSL